MNDPTRVDAPEYNRSMAGVPDRPLPPEPQFRTLLRRLIDVPNSALNVPKAAITEAEAKRVKRPRRKKHA